jgi:hypothetical protein
MSFGRTFLICSLLGFALLNACEDEPETNTGDSGIVATGGAAGTTAGGVAAGGITAGGTTAGAVTGGGTTGGLPGGSPGTPGAGSPGTAGGAGSPGGTTGGTGTTGGAPSGLTGGNTGGAAAGTTGGGTTGGGTTGGATPGGGGGSCPAVTDYAAKGPFDAKVFDGVGPTGGYMLVRPDTTLGKDGFKHPVAVWGNGIATSADQYRTLLSHIASHGFVVIACPDATAERPCLNDGMEWLVKQNTAEGPMKGKLDITKELTIGYSWGGGAAIDTANRPNVKATISIHGMPPREADPWGAMKSPLLLFTSTGDTFVSAEMYVTPNYNSSKVPTFYATLQEEVGHLYPLDEDAISCVAGILLGGPCSASIKEQAPIVAWLRLWACDDQNAKKYFYGPDCTLCKSPWKSQNKPTGAWQ